MKRQEVEWSVAKIGRKTSKMYALTLADAESQERHDIMLRLKPLGM
jgi:hypothetical protein